MLIILIAGCSAGPSLEEVDSVVNHPAMQTEAAIPTIAEHVPSPTQPQKYTNTSNIPTNTLDSSEILANTPDIPVIPANTAEPLHESARYCDFDDAMRVVARIDEITKVSEDDTNSNSDQSLSEAQRLLVVAAYSEKILEFDLMTVPGCLEMSIKHLRASYIAMRDLFSVSEDNTTNEAMELLFLAGQEQKLFDEEYARVKECIPTGCQ